MHFLDNHIVTLGDTTLTLTPSNTYSGTPVFEHIGVLHIQKDDHTSVEADDQLIVHNYFNSQVLINNTHGYIITDGKAVLYTGEAAYIASAVLYKLGEEPQELIDALAYKTPEETIAHFKGLYLGVVDAKLKELDYDSLATVKLWEGDAQFGAEATNILDWYKSIISYNYGLISSGVVPTDEEYLAGVPNYV